MKSNIINYAFDFIEWPTTHKETKRIFGPFNQSVFRLRKKYKHVFPELVDAHERFDENNEAIKLHSTGVL